MPADLCAQSAHLSGAIRTLNNTSNGTPLSVAVDSNGNVFYADYNQATINELVAVNGVVPDNPTTRILTPGTYYGAGMAVDSDGSLYFTDHGSESVNELQAVNGTIPDNPTVITLSSGFNRLEGIAVSPDGLIVVADLGAQMVYRFLKAEGHYIPRPVGGAWSDPFGVAVDANDNIFVEEGAGDVKETTTTSQTETTVASGLTNPEGIARDGNGDLFIIYGVNAEHLEELLAVDGSLPANPTVVQLGNDFNQLSGVAVDTHGNVFLADGLHSAVKELLNLASFVPTTVGTTSAMSIPFYFTFDTAGELGNVIVLTQGVTGLDFTDAGTGTCTAGVNFNAGQVCTVHVNFKPTAPGARLGAVEFLDVDANPFATGYVLGTGVGPRVNFMPGQLSTPMGGLKRPYATALDASGNLIVADSEANTVTQVVAVNGRIPANPTVKILGSGFSAPHGVAVDGSGNIFVADYGNNAVKEIVAAGGYDTVVTIGSGFSGPFGVAVDGFGNVYVADYGNHAVKEILFAGGYTEVETLGSGFSEPVGLAVDSNGNVFVSDYAGAAVNEMIAVNGSIPANPTINTLGSGLSGPWGIAVDANGNVVVSDYGNNAVKEMVAVNGVVPASPTIKVLQSGFNGPTGLAVESHGNVFIADSINARIEELDYADPPSLKFATTAVGSTSSVQTVALVNGGNAALTAVPPGITVPADFKLVTGSGACANAFSVAASASCNLNIEFAPTKTGNPLNEALVLTDNSFNTGPAGYLSQTIALSGISTGAVTTAALTTPAPGSRLTSTSVNFSWTAATGATTYALNLGSTGAGSSNVYNSGHVTTTSVTATGLPANGETLYAELWAYVSNKWVTTNYIYTAASTNAALTNPAPGSTLAGATVTFTWTPALGATTYALNLGSTGANSSNLYNSGHVTGTSVTANNLPINGETIYAELWAYVGNKWVTTDYTYKAGGKTTAAITSPAPGSTLTGSSVTFTWTAATGATTYALNLGSTGAGSSNLYNSGHVTTTSVTATSLPTNGETIYAELWAYVNNAWVTTNYTYKAQ